MVDALFATFIALVIAYILSEIFRYFKLPRVIGQIFAGVILSVPVIKELIFTDEVYSVFSFIANIGIILLFFFVGLEINIIKFKKNFRESSLISIFNTTIPLVLGFTVSKYLFSLNNIESLIIGISLSVSSQAISLDILEEVKLLKSKIGNLIITSGTVDDMFELFLVSSILVIFNSAAISGQMDFQKLFLDILIFVVVIIIFRFSLIPFALKLFERDKSHDTLFMGALIIVLLIAYLSEILGIGSFIGALIAGVLVRQTLLTGENQKPWEKNQISHSIHTISFGFLIPIFFVTVGLKTELSSLSSNIFFVMVLIIIDLVGTLAGTIIGVLLSKGNLREGMIVGWGVIPKGDTELVIATLALNNDLISVELFTAIIAVALFSTFFAPIVFKYLIKDYND